MGNRRHIPRPVKEMVVSLAARGYTSRKIADILEMSPRTVRRILSLVSRTGCVVRKPIEVGRHRLLNGLHAAFLEGCIERTPDVELVELQKELSEYFGVSASTVTISRTLRRRGLTRKKVTREALERNEDVRDAYLLNVGQNYHPEQLVFVDESAFNRNTTRRKMAWAPFGSRARRRDFFVRGQRYSILPALSLDGIVHLDIQERAYNGVLFHEFIDGLLDNMNPFPAPNSVIVMDNASIHHVEGIREVIEARGMRLLYLPPYSPDFNPIEEAFSAMKTWIRSNRDFVRGEITGDLSGDPYSILWEAVFATMTPDRAAGWFRDSGY